MNKRNALKLRQAKLARYKNGSYAIKIEFPFDPTDVANVKTLPGRKYNRDHKIWTCPPTKKALRLLKQWGFIIDQKLVRYLEDQESIQSIGSIPGLKKELFPYQKGGVGFIEKKNGRALIGDEMGLGKTVQAIAWMMLHPERTPVVIVCPASVKLNWRNEIRSWTGRKAEVLSGTSPDMIMSDIVIINYDILETWLPEIMHCNPRVIILDEIQYIKNTKAKRTKATRKLTKHAPYVIGLSGTPIVNRPVEFYNVLQILNPNLFPNWFEYTGRYCGRKSNGFGWDVSGATNTEELHEIVSDAVMLRRTKAEVLADLPPKIRSYVPIELSPSWRQEYDQAERNFIEWVRMYRGNDAADRASNAAALTEIEVLKQVAVRAKMASAIQWISDFLESGEKLVVFCVHKFVVDALMETFHKTAVKIDGSVSSTERQLAVEKFQNEPEKRLFVGNIKAAGVGITLTAASNVAFLELPWTPGDVSQSEDRCHRIGQKDSVNIYYLLSEGTIEERIAALLDDKREVLDAVLDGVQTSERSLLTVLMQDYI